jgi:glyoxylase-like metal-dependent hydrolase (beta-lactamase superfamily II)
MGRGRLPVNSQVTSLDLSDLTVHVFTASEENFLINSAIFELAEELVVVDAQMFVPDARAFADEIAGFGKPVRQFVLSHNHPDHFLGFEELRRRFPDVPIAALPGVIDYVERLGPEIVRNRKAELGDLVASRAIVPDTALAPGEQTIGGVRFRFESFDNAEAESQVVIHLPDHATMAVFDLACRAENHCFTVLPEFDHWLEVLRHLREEAGDVRHLIVGHGLPTDTTALDGTIEYALAAKQAYAQVDGPDEYAAAMKERFPDRGQRKWIEFSALLLYRVIYP